MRGHLAILRQLLVLACFFLERPSETSCQRRVPRNSTRVAYNLISASQTLPLFSPLQTILASAKADATTPGKVWLVYILAFAPQDKCSQEVCTRNIFCWPEG